MADDQLSTPRQLLTATDDLTRQVRKAQRGAWFPLVLLGLVVAAGAPFYRLGSPTHLTCGPVTTTHLPGGASATIKTCYIAYGWSAFIYWTAALILAYLAIAGFYVLKARRRGVGTRIRPYVIAGIAGLVLVAALWLVERYPGHGQSRYPSPLVVHGLDPLLAIAIALIVLAWVERSWALLVFAACYLVAVLANLFDITPLLSDHGWVIARQWIFLPRLWLAGGVLLLGGAGFAIAERLRT